MIVVSTNLDIGLQSIHLQNHKHADCQHGVLELVNV
jgi:hypothetical protein